MTRRLSALLLVGLALAVVAGCGSDSTSPDVGTGEARPATAVHDLSSLLALRARFNDDRGSTRVLLLLSPT